MTSNHIGTYASNVVLDLEFTPAGHAGRAQRLTDEIIEVGAVKVSPEGRVVGEFSQLVKPTLTKGVGGFVHHLTGIGDEDLIQARPLEDVLPAFAAWVGPGARMITWSPTDRLQFTHECAAKGLDADAHPAVGLTSSAPTQGSLASARAPSSLRRPPAGVTFPSRPAARIAPSTMPR